MTIYPKQMSKCTEEAYGLIRLYFSFLCFNTSICKWDVMSSDCIHYNFTDDLCSETPAVLTIELIAFNQSTSELIMATENVTSLVIKQWIACWLNVGDRSAYFIHFTSIWNTQVHQWITVSYVSIEKVNHQWFTWSCQLLNSCGISFYRTKVLD